MNRMNRKPRQRRSANPPVNEEPSRRLDFAKGDERGGRVGDRKSPADVSREFPPARVRQAGMTAGETVDGEVTADDLAPETLLDDDRSRTPAARARRAAQDTVLRRVDEAEIGAGHGKDEAELAQDENGGGRDGDEGSGDE